MFIFEHGMESPHLGTSGRCGPILSTLVGGI